jgi:hypothetical protein
MQTIDSTAAGWWTLPAKVLFRFFFIYFLLLIAPWTWLYEIPGAYYVLSWSDQLSDWLVIQSNFYVFRVFNIQHVHPVSNGSGDTSFSWAQMCLFLSVAFIGCIIWSVADRKRKGYRQLNYVLCLLIRYNLVIIAFGYGFSKVFYMQMPFPMLSQMATPLGDLLPMRFSWLFIGYSAPYEMFSGVMEVLAGALLLWRRTATMGVLVATGVFINVLMLNLCYDIPVKLFSMTLVVMCMYLLVNEYKRIACFFLLNKVAPACTMYHHPITKRWLRVTRVVLKVMIIFYLGKSLYAYWVRSSDSSNQADIKPIERGVYNVVKFAVNSDTLAPLITDTTRWQDIIFEGDGIGSIQAADTAFRMRYGRAYFFYKPDTLQQTIAFRKYNDDTLPITIMHYQMAANNTIYLKGKRQQDSLYVELRKSERHYPLSEKQFHWLSEANR